MTIELGGDAADPREIEAVLNDHPDVAAIAVIAAPTADGRERLVGVIQGHTGVNPNLAAIQALCVHRLRPGDSPRDWGVVDAMPRTTDGAVDRERLRESVAAGAIAVGPASWSMTRPRFTG